MQPCSREMQEMNSPASSSQLSLQDHHHLQQRCRQRLLLQNPQTLQTVMELEIREAFAVGIRNDAVLHHMADAYTSAIAYHLLRVNPPLWVTSAHFHTNAVACHLLNTSSDYTLPRNYSAQQLELMECASKAAKLTVDTSSLSICMKGKHREIRDRVVEYFNKRPKFQTPMEILKDNYQELCMKQLVGLGREAEIRLF